MDGLIDGYNSEGELDEPGASVGKDVAKTEEDGVSSKALRNMENGMAFKKQTSCIQQNTSNHLEPRAHENIACGTW